MRNSIVSDRQKADLILLFSAHEYAGGYVTSTTGRMDGFGNINTMSHATPTSVAYTFITVIDPKTGDNLWSDSKQWGNLYNGFHSATRRLVDELRRRIAEEEGNRPLDNSISNQRPQQVPETARQVATNQPEPDCGTMTEEDARREGFAWAQKHPEYHLTPEKDQKIVGYLEGRGLCPTQENLDKAYNALQSELK